MRDRTLHAVLRAVGAIGFVAVCLSGSPLIASAQSSPSSKLVVSTPVEGTVINGDISFSGTAAAGEGIAVCTPSGDRYVLGGAAIAGSNGVFQDTLTASFLPQPIQGAGSFAVIFVDAGAGPVASSACDTPGVQSVSRILQWPGTQAPATPLVVNAPVDGTAIDGVGLAFGGTATPGDGIAVCAPQSNGIFAEVSGQLVGSSGTFSGTIPASALPSRVGTFSVVFIDAGPGPTPSTVCGQAWFSVVARSVQFLGTTTGTGGDGTGIGQPNPSQTPELDSLVLFGTGVAGLAVYASKRLRARRH